MTDRIPRAGDPVSGGRDPAVRRGPLVAEIAVYVLAGSVDVGLAVRSSLSGSGVGVLDQFGDSASFVVAALVALRVRFPRRLPSLAAGALVTASAGPAVVGVGALSGVHWRQGSGLLTVLAVVVLAAAVCRRLPPVPASACAVAALVVCAVLPLTWPGPAARVVVAVPAVALWGIAVALGLILRDADARRGAEAERTRTGERLRIARELHDVVAHHVTGIVVSAQAARLVAGRPPAPGRPAAGSDAERYTEIEEAARTALTAMRRLVRMLRSDDEPVLERHGVGRAIQAAAADDPDARVSVAAELDTMTVRPDVASTAYWITLEALTNARRHAPLAAEVTVAAWLERAVFTTTLVVEIGNDRGPLSPEAVPGGFGLIGMRERVTAVGGTLHAGPDGAGRWRVTARLPFEPAGGDAGSSEGV